MTSLRTNLLRVLLVAQAVAALELDLGASPAVLALLQTEPAVLEYGAPSGRATTAAAQPRLSLSPTRSSSPQGATLQPPAPLRAAERDALEARHVDDGYAPPPKFVRLNVDLGERQESLVAKPGDDVDALVASFCTEHALDPAQAAPTIAGGLRDLLEKAARMEQDEHAAAASAGLSSAGGGGVEPRPALDGDRAGADRGAGGGAALLPFADGVFRLGMAGQPPPPAIVSLRVQSSQGVELGRIDATPGADLGALAAAFLERHAGHPELRLEAQAHGPARLRDALAAMLASRASQSGRPGPALRWGGTPFGSPLSMWRRDVQPAHTRGSVLIASCALLAAYVAHLLTSRDWRSIVPRAQRSQTQR